MMDLDDDDQEWLPMLDADEEEMEEIFGGDNSFTWSHYTPEERNALEEYEASVDVNEEFFIEKKRRRFQPYEYCKRETSSIQIWKVDFSFFHFYGEGFFLLKITKTRTLESDIRNYVNLTLFKKKLSNAFLSV